MRLISQLIATLVTGNRGSVDLSQMRVGRSQNGVIERMGRAVYQSLLQTAYQECLKATDGIRFKRDPPTRIANHPEREFFPSVDQMIPSSLNFRDL